MTNETIMLLSETFSGGVKTHLKILNNGIKEYKLITVCSSRDQSLKNQDSSEKSFANLVYINELSSKNPINYFKAVMNVKKIVRKENVKLIHAHSTIAGITIFLLKYVLLTKNVAYLFTPHAYYSQKPSNSFKLKIIKSIERLINKVPSYTIHVSKDEEEYAIKNNITNKKKSYVIYNGIERENRDTEFNINGNKIVFGNLARVDYQKNPDRFYSIAKKISEYSSFPVEFIYGGNGELLELMTSKVKRDRLDNQIKFIGFTSDLDEFFNKIDCFLSTAYYEGLPYSVIEAISYKKPVFLSDVVGHRELVDNNGVLFNLELSDDNIAKKIVNIIESRELLKEYSLQSSNLFERKFTSGKMIKEITKVYNKLLDKIPKEEN